MPVKKISRKDQAALSLKLADLQAGHYLLYKLTVRGSQGVFSLVDDKEKEIMTNKDFPPAQNVYERKWPVDGRGIPSESDVTHTLALSFASAAKYVYEAHHCDGDGNKVALIKDVDFESDDPTDTTFNTLRIFLKVG